MLFWITLCGLLLSSSLALCEDISSLFGSISSNIYGRNSTKFIEWRFIAPKTDEFMLNIHINSISSNSFEGGSYFTLPDGTNITAAHADMCSSYAPSAGSSYCTGSLAKKYCPGASIHQAPWPASIKIYTTSSRNDSNYHSYYMNVLFSYAYVFCPDPVIVETTPQDNSTIDSTTTKPPTGDRDSNIIVLTIILPVLVAVVCGAVIALLLVKLRRLQKSVAAENTLIQMDSTNSHTNKSYCDIEITTRQRMEDSQRHDGGADPNTDNTSYDSFTNIAMKQNS